MSRFNVHYVYHSEFDIAVEADNAENAIEIADEKRGCDEELIGQHLEDLQDPNKTATMI